MSRRTALALGAVAAGALAVYALTAPPDAGPGAPAYEGAGPDGAGGGPVAVVGPDPERGAPAFAARFDPADHGGHRQSWAVVQAPTGLVYVANTDGLLEYDGAAWRLVPVPGHLARGLAVGPDGAVYVGGEGTAGVVVADSAGRPAYREVVGPDVLDGDVWAAAADDSGVVFQTFGRLVRVARVAGPSGPGWAVVDVARAPEGRRFHKLFGAGGRVYVRLEGAGLLAYDGGRLRPVPGSGPLADRPARALFDVDGRPGGPLLVVTDDELFRLDPTAAVPFAPVPTAAAAALRATRAYAGCPLGPAEGPGRLFAVTTMGGGVVVVDRAGRVAQRLGAEAGLTADDLVLGCATDAQGGLWLALSEGVVRVDAAAPLSRFGPALGLPGVVYAVARHRGRVYAGTARGAYRLAPSADGGPARFEPVVADGLDQVWALLPTPTGLLAAATGGVYAVDGLRAERVADRTAFALAAGPDGAVWAGLRDGLAVLRPSEAGAGWGALEPVAGVAGEVRSVVATDDGGAWAAEYGGRLVRVGPGGSAEAFGAGDGVPDDLAFVLRIGGGTVAAAAGGLYRVADDGRVRPAADLTRLARGVAGRLADGFGTFEDEAGRVWVNGRDRLGVFARGGGPGPDAGAWRDVTPPAVGGLSGVQVVASDGPTVWAGGDGGLARLVADGRGRYGVRVPALVRSVAVDGRAAGGGPAGAGPVEAPYGAPVRFGFTAAAYADADGTRFQTRLDGFDPAWSPWSDERVRDYTNLPPGAYTFRVRARTAQGVEAAPAAASLVVPAPWFLTPWFFALAGLAGLAAVAGVARAASARHRRRADAEGARAEAESARAEAEARAATAERARADESDRLNGELRRADRLKDEMLSNASHELRTPLTAVIGFAEILAEYDGADAAEVRELASHALSGGRRLLGTVDDLLDLARLRAGKVELAPSDVDAADVVRCAVGGHRAGAREKGLGVHVVPQGTSLPARLDAEALARVVGVLVDNAVKFTEAGYVAVAVDGDDHDVRVTVRDTGRGIDPAFVPRLFDEFVQESTGHARVAEGSGLGLAITGRLVGLMGGAVRVESAVGAGTTVRVRVARWAGPPADPPDPPAGPVGDGAAPAEAPAVGPAERPAAVTSASDSA